MTDMEHYDQQGNMQKSSSTSIEKGKQARESAHSTSVRFDPTAFFNNSEVPPMPVDVSPQQSLPTNGSRGDSQPVGTLMIGKGGRSKYLGPTAGSDWLKDVSARSYVYKSLTEISKKLPRMNHKLSRACHHLSRLTQIISGPTGFLSTRISVPSNYLRVYPYKAKPFVILIRIFVISDGSTSWVFFQTCAIRFEADPLGTTLSHVYISMLCCPRFTRSSKPPIR